MNVEKIEEYQKEEEWKKHEKDDAKTFSGYRQRGSGNNWYAPGDVKNSDFLIEDKQTDKKSYSVSLKVWNKLYEDALFSYKMPILSLKIKDTELVVLAKDDFMEILTKKRG